jgi:peptidoglycan/xylan/chitin deacetylase (PgdA/CDA1 family)
VKKKSPAATVEPPKLLTALTVRTKQMLKTVLPYTQLLGLYHRYRNRDTLTVVVFHRVLAVDDERWPHAHPEWTVSDTVFDECLQFFRRYYHVISLQELLASLEHGTKLPSRSLLVTFDDGYADNEQYALPLLQRDRVPAVLFATSDFLNREHRLWTEDLVAGFRERRISAESIAELYRALFEQAQLPPDPLKQLNEISARWPDISDEEVDHLCRTHLGQPLQRFSKPAHMLTSEQLRHLHAAGIAIGAHGKTHTSLPLSANLKRELAEPRRTLAELLNLQSVDEISALAFPFGDHSEAVVGSALAEGYKLLFTFKPAITKLSNGRLAGAIVDRVNVSAPIIAPEGTATPERLARCLFFVPRTASAA